MSWMCTELKKTNKDAEKGQATHVMLLPHADALKINIEPVLAILVEDD